MDDYLAVGHRTGIIWFTGRDAGTLGRFAPPNYRQHVAKATTSLWVPYLAGTLSGLDTCSDTLHDVAETYGKELRSDGGRAMPETVTYEYIIGGGVLTLV